MTDRNEEMDRFADFIHRLDEANAPDEAYVNPLLEALGLGGKQKHQPEDTDDVDVDELIEGLLGFRRPRKFGPMPFAGEFGPGVTLPGIGATVIGISREDLTKAVMHSMYESRIRKEMEAWPHERETLPEAESLEKLARIGATAVFLISYIGCPSTAHNLKVFLEQNRIAEDWLFQLTLAYVSHKKGRDGEFNHAFVDKFSTVTRLIHNITILRQEATVKSSNLMGTILSFFAYEEQKNRDRPTSSEHNN